jgi:hypothetical protein
MKQLIGTILLVLFTGSVWAMEYGNWYANGEINKHGLSAAITFSQKFQDTFLVIGFDTKSQCQVVAGFGMKTDEIKGNKHSVVDLDVEMRIDKGDIWYTDEPARKIQNGMGVILFNITPETVAEIMQGNTLRIKILDVYDRFSLSGSTKAINRAMTTCLKNQASDGDYFNASDDPDADHFI